MRDWQHIHTDAGIDVFFCDPHPPASAALTTTPTDLLRQYWPKGTDFSTNTEAQVDAVADERNERPRKRLEFANPPSASPSCCCSDRSNPPIYIGDSLTRLPAPLRPLRLLTRATAPMPE